MNCQNCGTALSGKQTVACSKPCKIKLDGTKRKESGRLRKANMDSASYEKKLKANKAWKCKLADRQCIICKEVKQVRISHATTRPVCLKCSHLWKSTKPSTSTELAKRYRPRIYIPQAIQGKGFIGSQCTVCGKYVWHRQPILYCSTRCVRKIHDRAAWISKPMRLKIYERDKGVCQLCLKPVDMSHDYHTGGHNPLGPSLDHILPVSKGGDDLPSNLRLAHHLCNTLRGADL